MDEQGQSKLVRLTDTVYIRPDQVVALVGFEHEGKHRTTVYHSEGGRWIATVPLPCDQVAMMLGFTAS